MQNRRAPLPLRKIPRELLSCSIILNTQSVLLVRTKYWKSHPPALLFPDNANSPFLSPQTVIVNQFLGCVIRNTEIRKDSQNIVLLKLFPGSIPDSWQQQQILGSVWLLGFPAAEINSRGITNFPGFHGRCLSDQRCYPLTLYRFEMDIESRS